MWVEDELAEYAKKSKLILYHAWIFKVSVSYVDLPVFYHLSMKHVNH